VFLTGVARWFVFIPKIPIRVYCGAPWEGKMLVYFMTIWNILWQFGIVCGNLVYFFCFGMFVPRKIWQPWYLREDIPNVSG
jgi:hypothetical protein